MRTSENCIMATPSLLGFRFITLPPRRSRPTNGRTNERTPPRRRLFRFFVLERARRKFISQPSSWLLANLQRTHPSRLKVIRWLLWMAMCFAIYLPSCTCATQLIALSKSGSGSYTHYCLVSLSHNNVYIGV